MKVQLICYYCDHKWEDNIWSNDISDKKCSKCEDKRLKIRELASDAHGMDAFGYRFSPPFPEKKREVIEPSWPPSNNYF
jgi:hypothetical protein